MNWVSAYIIVSWIAGICGIFGVLRQPSAAFRNAGKSKLVWLLIQLAGFVSSFFGIFTWAAWHFGALPAVRRSGGRQPRPRMQRQAIPYQSTAGAPPTGPKPLPRPSQIPSLVATPGAVFDEPGFYLTPQGLRYWTGFMWQ